MNVRKGHASPLQIASVIFLFLISCGGEKKPPPSPLQARFTAPGTVEISGARQASFVEVQSESETPLARGRSFGRDVFEIRFDWQANTSYRFVPDAEAPAVVVRSPEKKPRLALRVHAPLGQNVHEYLIGEDASPGVSDDLSVPCEPNETLDILLELENLGDEKHEALRLSMTPKPGSLNGPDGAFEDKPAPLRFEFDKQLLQGRVRIGDTLPAEPILISLSGPKTNVAVRLHFSKRDVKDADLALVERHMPCDAQGMFTPGRAPDQIVLPNRVWEKIGAFFNVQTEQISYYHPFVFERFDFENKQAHPLNLLLKGEVRDEKTGKTVPYFSAPNYTGTGLVKPVTAYCRVPAGKKKSCVLPVFVTPDTRAGTYKRRVEILAMGSDKPLRTVTSRVGVIRSHLLLSAWLAVSVIVSISWLLVIIIFYKKLVASFGVRILVLLSLLGSMKFCLYFAGSLISQVLYAFLGPFNCLVGGLLTEVLTYLIVTSVLFFVPRVGAMTLAGIVSWLINGILFGSFGLTDILFSGSQIAFWEIFLFLFGVTTFRKTPRRKPKIVPLMIALGLADAAHTLTSLTLHSVFFRLFFADWYIVLQVAVTGFLYTALGVYLGRSLGLVLTKVHR